MTITTSDDQRLVDIGASDVFYALYSTVSLLLSGASNRIAFALRFMQSGKCSHTDAMETARQFNIIRDELSRFSPSEAVYDMRDRSREAPWKNSLSEVITSCANLFTTADGKDLLYEIVSILCYAGLMSVSVTIT